MAAQGRHRGLPLRNIKGREPMASHGLLVGGPVDDRHPRVRYGHSVVVGSQLVTSNPKPYPEPFTTANWELSNVLTVYRYGKTFSAVRRIWLSMRILERQFHKSLQ